jgi:hypothetical protein
MLTRGLMLFVLRKSGSYTEIYRFGFQTPDHWPLQPRSGNVPTLKSGNVTEMSLGVQDNALQASGPAIWLLDGDAHRLSHFQEAIEKEPPSSLRLTTFSDMTPWQTTSEPVMVQFSIISQASSFPFADSMVHYVDLSPGKLLLLEQCSNLSIM